MTKVLPKVTVVIAAYSAADSLEAAVTSALSQEGAIIDVVIVDDLSPDDTFAAASELAQRNPAVTAVRMTQNGGPAGARNTALNTATGDWIAVLDADDRFDAGRLAALCALADRTGADVVLGNLQEVDQTDTPLDDPFISHPRTPVEWTPETFVRGNLGAAGPRTSGYLKPVFRKAFLDAHGIRYDATLRNGEDFHIIMSCYLAGASVWFSPEPAYRYTRRAGSISHRADLDHLKALLAADAQLARREDQSPALNALLNRRVRETADLLATETAMRAIKAHQPHIAARALLRRPQAMGRFARQLREAMMKRL